MNRKLLLIVGAIGLAVGVILIIQAHNVNGSISANLTKLLGGTTPGNTEMISGVLICLGGVIMMIVGGFKNGN